MNRLILAAVLAATLTPASAAAQTSDFGRRDWCDDFGSRRRATQCETREETLSGDSIEVDARSNGGIRVRGWDRGDTQVRALMTAVARSDARAREILSQVRLVNQGGRLHAEGPNTDGDEWWSVSYELQVPRRGNLRLDARNGGISIEEFGGSAIVRTTNGGIRLDDVSGDIRGETTNGGVNVSLRGSRWEGRGLDLQTRNGGVRMTVPADYNADLETGTVNGGVNIDFPITVQGNLRDFRRRISTRLGTGGPLIRLMTTNGGVSIQRR